jgi:molybdopterin molybdotransferase
VDGRDKPGNDDLMHWLYLRRPRCFGRDDGMRVPPQAIQRPARLAPLQEIYAGIDALAMPVAPREVDLAHALGRVLAADAAAPTPVPVTAIAMRDGWAIRADVVSDAGPYAPIPLSPTWVDTGEPLPHDADAVLLPDAVAARGDTAEALVPAVAGEGVLAAGADADPARPLRRAGERMRSIDVAALRAAGVPRLRVREPRVAVFCANVLIDAVDDTVAPLIVRAIEANGGLAAIERATLDGGPSLENALRDDTVDAVVVVGGTGAGRHDASVRTLAGIGRVDIHGMGIRPGDTAALGAVGTRPVLMLPGRLDAALAIWLVAGERLLDRLTGLGAREEATPVRLARKVVSTVGLAEVVAVGHCEGGVEPLASAYFPLQSLARAAGWILIPPESEGFPAGTTVALRPFP